jgi:hypothetical protein
MLVDMWEIFSMLRAMKQLVIEELQELTFIRDVIYDLLTWFVRLNL